MRYIKQKIHKDIIPKVVSSTKRPCPVHKLEKRLTLFDSEKKLTLFDSKGV